MVLSLPPTTSREKSNLRLNISSLHKGTREGLQNTSHRICLLKGGWGWVGVRVSEYPSSCNLPTSYGNAPTHPKIQQQEQQRRLLHAWSLNLIMIISVIVFLHSHHHPQHHHCSFLPIPEFFRVNGIQNKNIFDWRNHYPQCLSNLDRSGENTL